MCPLVGEGLSILWYIKPRSTAQQLEEQTMDTRKLVCTSEKSQSPKVIDFCTCDSIYTTFLK